MIQVLTRFVLPLGFAAIGISWSLGGEWQKFLVHQDGVFSSYQITDYAFRGSFLFGSMGAAVGIAIERNQTRRDTAQRNAARQRLITQVQRLTGSNLPDETRAAICLVLEDLQNAEL